MTFPRVLGFAAVLSVVAFAQPPAGVGNFHQVNAQLYRGAQPTALGFQSLAKMGVKTILDLRESGSRSLAEQKMVEAAGMRYVSMPFSGFSAPSPEQVSKVLALFNDASSGPVFVHCRRGADRTGTVVACYRVAHDRWTNGRALSEAKADGMSWTEIAMHHFVQHYQPPPAVASAATQPQTTSAGN
jgi:tyrosine-protein phosphatase SIW14